MNRKEFFNKIGFGAAFALTVTCLHSCEKENTTPTGPVDFTLNLSDLANVALANIGGYVIQNAVVIAKTATGYAAATVICSHEGQQQITYRGTPNQWYCTAHGATFDINGVGQNANGSKGLTIYKTSLSANNLRVYS